MRKLYVIALLLPLLTFSQAKNIYKNANFTSAPIFPGCEGFYDSEKEKRKCFLEKLQQHIADNFQYPKVALRKKIQ